MNAVRDNSSAGKEDIHQDDTGTPDVCLIGLEEYEDKNGSFYPKGRGEC